MCECIKSEGHLANNAVVVRDISICIHLIDIFMEQDAVFNTWLHQSFSGEMSFRKMEDGNYELDDTNRKPIDDYPVYVNVRNERRFFRSTPVRDAQQEGNRDRAILSIVSLRQQKALHLYHLIREYKMFSWWD
jgi:hypothetical protein